MAPKAKKVPAPKVHAAKAAPRPARTAEAPPPDAKEHEHLDHVVDELFHIYDEDGDGQVERVEFLDTEEHRQGRLEFGPKERKAAYTWFKEAGAEGNPTDGMFLDRAKFGTALVKLAATEAGVAETEFKKLADWLTEHRLQPLQAAHAARHPEAPPPAAATGEAPTPSVPPRYPLTCTLKDLATRLKEARSVGRMALVLSSGLAEVETFMTYQVGSIIDCKLLLSEVFIGKSKTKDEAREELRKTLGGSMNCGGFTRPLHVRLANSAFDWNNFCGEGFPREVFSATLWTIQHAFELGFFDAGQKVNLEIEDEKKWKDFQIILTSTFDLDQANEFLFDKIPFYDELAIIVVDPASVA